jgi:hypothetical protein
MVTLAPMACSASVSDCREPTEDPWGAQCRNRVRNPEGFVPYFAATLFTTCSVRWTWGGGGGGWAEEANRRIQAPVHIDDTLPSGTIWNWGDGSCKTSTTTHFVWLPCVGRERFLETKRPSWTPTPPLLFKAVHHNHVRVHSNEFDRVMREARHDLQGGLRD